MLHLLLVLVPLGLAAAISPVMLTEQTVLLAGPRGRRTGMLYAAGTATVLVVVVAAVLLVGRSLSLPTEVHLNASLDVLIGAVLLLLAVALRLARPRDHHGRARSRNQMSQPTAYGFGVFSMATNFTTLALVVPAAREVAATDVPVWGHLLAAALLVALASLPAWGPVALDTAAPEAAGSLLDRVDRLIRRHGRLIVVVLIGAAGTFLLVRGIARLVGL